MLRYLHVGQKTRSGWLTTDNASAAPTVAAVSWMSAVSCEALPQQCVNLHSLFFDAVAPSMLCMHCESSAKLLPEA